jgi:3'-phosphoadenosine 5'-phosphosulfate (PAPS) 3'-phosphatase
MAVATYAVQLASTVARELQKALATRTAMAKTDESPVTVADFTVQVRG